MQDENRDDSKNESQEGKLGATEPHPERRTLNRTQLTFVSIAVLLCLALIGGSAWSLVSGGGFPLAPRHKARDRVFRRATRPPRARSRNSMRRMPPRMRPMQSMSPSLVTMPLAEHRPDSRAMRATRTRRDRTRAETARVLRAPGRVHRAHRTLKTLQAPSPVPSP